jgi:hypothetical protein
MVLARFTGFLGRKCVSRRKEGVWGLETLKLSTKHSWPNKHEVVDGADSLCAKVLKARYFKNSDLLHASCPGQGSFTWRSILHGRDLLETGLVWRIGDGTKVDVWKSSWIPRGGSQRPLGRKPDAASAPVRTVSDLLSNNGTTWNVEKLHQYIYDFDVADIVKISVGGPWVARAWRITMLGILLKMECSLSAPPII